MAATPQFVGAINNQFRLFTSADPNTQLVFQPSAADGALVRGMSIYLTAAAARTVLMFIRDANDDDLMLCQTSIVPNVPVNLIDPQYLPMVDPAPNRGLPLQIADRLMITVSPVIEVGEYLQVCVFGGDY